MQKLNHMVDNPSNDIVPDYSVQVIAWTVCLVAMCFTMCLLN